jgi:N-methylhydantoinase A/oxoprolinase/acetone carboxylase beta subunit
LDRGGTSLEGCLGRRQAIFGNGRTEVPVLRWSQWPALSHISGPAIFEQSTTSVVVEPGDRLTYDDFGNDLIYKQHVGLETSLAGLRESAK